MANKILEMRSITKRFPGVLALDQVSFEAYSGEILAICGENGAGKSTLMKVLSGSYSCSTYEGEIWVDGVKQNFLNTNDSEKAGIAMIYQEISMHLDMTIAENLFLNRLYTKGKYIVDWKRMYKEAVPYLKRVGLGDLDPKTTLRQLNPSQQQLVAIARALSKQPRILILDEPTSPLTLRESERLFAILQQLKQDGIACILITHKMDEVFSQADRVTVLRDGKTISTREIAETNRDKVVADMVGRSIESYYPKEIVPIGDVVLRAEDITVPHPYIPDKNIIDGATFEVHAGEILGIAGLIGAGRSEMVNAIFGSLRRTAGKIFLDGKEVSITKPKHAIANGIALITEDRKANGIIATMDIAKNITLASQDKFSRYGLINTKREQELASTYFERLNIKAPSMQTILNALSGGNQQKVIVAKWLIRNPRVLIMDEPTRGIDVGAKYEIYTIMTELAKAGVAIVMISSELPELISMSDRVLVIASGRIAGELKAGEATQQSIMQLATIGLDVEEEAV